MQEPEPRGGGRQQARTVHARRKQTCNPEDEQREQAPVQQVHEDVHPQEVLGMARPRRGLKTEGEERQRPPEGSGLTGRRKRQERLDVPDGAEAV